MLFDRPVIDGRDKYLGWEGSSGDGVLRSSGIAQAEVQGHLVPLVLSMAFARSRNNKRKRESRVRFNLMILSKRRRHKFVWTPYRKEDPLLSWRWACCYCRRWRWAPGPCGSGIPTPIWSAVEYKVPFTRDKMYDSVVPHSCLLGEVSNWDRRAAGTVRRWWATGVVRGCTWTTRDSSDPRRPVLLRTHRISWVCGITFLFLDSEGTI